MAQEPVVTIIAATPGTRIVSNEAKKLHLDEPVLAWRITTHSDSGLSGCEVTPITVRGAEEDSYGVQYADGSVSALDTLYDSLDEAQRDVVTE